MIYSIITKSTWFVVAFVDEEVCAEQVEFEATSKRQVFLCSSNKFFFLLTFANIFRYTQAFIPRHPFDLTLAEVVFPRVGPAPDDSALTSVSLPVF